MKTHFFLTVILLLGGCASSRHLNRPLPSLKSSSSTIDEKWKDYSTYLEKLISKVQKNWERINDQSHLDPPSGIQVTVKFRILAKAGEIDEIISSESTGGRQVERACISAITASSPYGKWNSEMVAKLGESQEITFTFYYH